MHTWPNRNFFIDQPAGLSVAYAAIAHFSIQAAITAALARLLCYARLGKSPYGHLVGGRAVGGGWRNWFKFRELVVIFNTRR